MFNITGHWYGTSMGGCTAQTRTFLHRLAGLIAMVEGVDVPKVKARLSEQLAVVLARVPSRALWSD